MKITTPREAFHYLRPRLCAEVEEFWVVALSSEKAVIASSCLFRGTVDLCMFHPRDVFRFACVQNASSLLVAHNHPLGAALPSAQDRKVTRQLIRAAKIMEIPVVDHLILTRSDYYSFLQSGEI